MNPRHLRSTGSSSSDEAPSTPHGVRSHDAGGGSSSSGDRRRRSSSTSSASKSGARKKSRHGSKGKGKASEDFDANGFVSDQARVRLKNSHVV